MARRKTSFTVRVEAEGVRETLAKFRHLPKDATKALKEGTREVSEKLASKARTAAMSDFAPQSKLVASSIKAVKDRVPAIQAGGTKRVGRNRVPTYKVLFGSEFGSDREPEFQRPHSGQEGHWFFPVVENNQRAIIDQWERVVDDVERKFTQGGE